MTRKKGSALSPKPQRLIEEFKAALTAEIEKIKENPNAIRWELRDGRLIGREGLVYLYEFTLDTLFNGVPDDSPVMLIAGQQSTKGYVVSLVGMQLTLAVEESIGDFVAKAVADIQPYWLLERLREKLDELHEEDVQLPLKCIEGVPSQVLHYAKRPSEVPTELNECQASAVHLALDNEVSYIWGPPGTGKTTTLAALAKAAIDLGQSLLLTAHTNVAVDQAILTSLRYLKDTEHYESGRILRFGSAHLPQVKDDENLNLDAVVERKSGPLRDRLNQLHSRVQTNEEKLSNLQQIKTRIAEFETLVAKTKEFDALLANERSRLEELKNEQDNLKASKTQAESMLERGRRMSWLGRLVRGINLQELDRLRTECETWLSKVSSEQKKVKEKLRRLEVERDSSNAEVLKAKGALEKTSIDSATIESQIAVLQEEMSVLKDQIEELQQQIAALRSQTIADAMMIATTVTGIYTNDELSDRRFDRLICDEASMVPFPMIFYAGRFAQGAITITGDFCQLAPITIEDADPLVRQWLRKSAFEVAELDEAGKIDKDPRAQMLEKQYRMRPQIRQLISEVFYDGKLQDKLDERKEENAKRQAEPCPGAHVAIYETSSMNPWCSRTKSWSRFNLYHALASVELAQRASKYFSPKDGQPSIGIIVPYRAQFHLVRALVEDRGLQSEVAVATVHRFQGAEKDVIIFDLVDSIGAKVGKLLRGGQKSDGARLINVACSRAREKLAVIANLQYFSGKLNNEDALAQVFDRLLKMTPHLEAQTLLPSEAMVMLDRALDLMRPEVLSMDTVEPHSLWKETEFHSGFHADIRGARTSLVILSPFVAPRRFGEYFPILQEKTQQGVEVVIVTRPPDRQGIGMRDEAGQAIHALERMGADIQERPWMHEKAAIIDNRVVWFGSLNILSHSNTEESMMRLCGEKTATQFLRQLGIAFGRNAMLAHPKIKMDVSKIPLKRCACGQTLVIVPKGKFGPFYKCPRCGRTASIAEEDLLGAIDLDQRICPNCKRPLKFRRSRNGAFLGCSGYPDCKYTIGF